MNHLEHQRGILNRIRRDTLLDHHFGHANIIKHCNRPFSSVEQMDSALVDLWNSVVGPSDEIYHLGDFAYKADPDRVEKLFKRLRGRKHLVIGNHDGQATLRLPWASPPVDRRIVRCLMSTCRWCSTTTPCVCGRDHIMDRFTYTGILMVRCRLKGDHWMWA